jgi:hypothetical protein
MTAHVFGHATPSFSACRASVRACREEAAVGNRSPLLARHLPDAIRLVGRRRSPRYGPHPQSSALGPPGLRPPVSYDPTAAQRLKCRPRQLTPLAAIACSILVIIFHLLADPETRYHDLGPGPLRHSHRPRPQDPQPHPLLPGPRPRGNHHSHRTRRLTPTAPQAPATAPGSLPPAR